MPAIPVHSLTDLAGNKTDGTWEPVAAQRNSVLDMSNPRFPRHIILDSTGVVITRPNQTPVHLSLSSILKAAIVANPMLTSPPVCVKEPVSITVKSGETAVFNVAFDSCETPVTGLQWESITKGVKDFSPLLGETTPSLSLTVNADMTGNQYRCIATSLAGSTASKSATLTVT